MKRNLAYIATSATLLLLGITASAADSETGGPQITKKVLIEEFTTMSCGNCPTAAGSLNTIMSSDEFSDVTVAVCHHSGYYTDMLTQPCDEAFLWFYPGTTTYAPAMMYDRAPIFKFNGAPAVLNEVTLSRIKISVRKCLEEPAKVSIDITPRYDRINGKLSVTVSGRDYGSEMTNPVLTVYLTENDVTSTQPQMGAGSNFKHQHVIRAYNSIWGTPVTFGGGDGDFREEVSFDIDQSWNRDKMHIVALVSNYNENDKTDCAVANAEQVAFPKSAGTECLADDADTVETRYYSTDGLELSDLTGRDGMAIEVRTLTDGRTETRKIRL